MISNLLMRRPTTTVLRPTDSTRLLPTSPNDTASSADPIANTPNCGQLDGDDYEATTRMTTTAGYSHGGGDFILSNISLFPEVASDTGAIDSDVVDQRYDDDDDDYVDDGSKNVSEAPPPTVPAETCANDMQHMRRLLDSASVQQRGWSAQTAATPAVIPASDSVSDNLPLNHTMPPAYCAPVRINKRKSSAPQCARAIDLADVSNSNIVGNLGISAARTNSFGGDEPYASVSSNSSSTIDAEQTNNMQPAAADDWPTTNSLTANVKPHTAATASPPPPPTAANGSTPRKNYCETCDQYFSTPSNFRKHLKTLVHITTKSRFEQQRHVTNQTLSFNTGRSAAAALLAAHHHQNRPYNAAGTLLHPSGGGILTSLLDATGNRTDNSGGGYFDINDNNNTNNNTNDSDVICTGSSSAFANSPKSRKRTFFNSVVETDHHPHATAASATVDGVDVPSNNNLFGNIVPAAAAQQQLNLGLLALAMQTCAMPNFTQQLTRAVVAAATQQQQQQQQTLFNNNTHNHSSRSPPPPPPLPVTGLDMSSLVQSLLAPLALTLAQQRQQTASPVAPKPTPFFTNDDAMPTLLNDDDDDFDDDTERTFQSPTSIAMSASNPNSNNSDGGGYENGDIDDGGDEDEYNNRLTIDDDINGDRKRVVASSRRRHTFGGVVNGGLESYKSPGGEIVTIEEPIVLDRPIHVAGGDGKPCIIGCRRCHKPFKTRTAYREHFRVVHIQHKPFSCGMCRKYFSCKSNYEKHLKTQVHRERDDVQLVDGTQEFVEITMAPPTPPSTNNKMKMNDKLITAGNGGSSSVLSANSSKRIKTEMSNNKSHSLLAAALNQPCLVASWRMQPPPPPPAVATNGHAPRTIASSSMHTSKSTWTPQTVMLSRTMPPPSPPSSASTAFPPKVPPLKVALNNSSSANEVKVKNDALRLQLASWKERQRQMQQVRQQLTHEVDELRGRHSRDVKRIRSLKGKLSWMDSYFNDEKRKLGAPAYDDVEREARAEHGEAEAERRRSENFATADAADDAVLTV